MVYCTISSPKNKNEFDDYYYFRWKYLRKPLNKKLGTEKDDIEDRSIHKMVINKEGLIIDLFRTLEASRRKHNI